MAERSVTLLVANPAARMGRAAAGIDRAMAALGAAGLKPEFVPTAPDGHAVDTLVDRIGRDDVARVVYLGGDGTFADAAKAIIGARERHAVDVPLGMLPMGTANNQGLSFGIPAGAAAIERNVEIIAAGREHQLDVGRIRAYDDLDHLVREDLWFDSCGFGLSPRILAQRNRDLETVERMPVVRHLYRDHMVYLRGFLAQFVTTVMTGWRFAGTITIDGVSYDYEDITDLIVLGTILYGGEWILAPQARPDDGRFEVVVVRTPADWITSGLRGLKRTPVADDGWVALGYAERAFPAGSNIEITLEPARHGRLVPAEQPVLAQIDGEEFPAARRYALNNLPRHLRIIVPENPKWI